MTRHVHDICIYSIVKLSTLYHRLIVMVGWFHLLVCSTSERQQHALLVQGHIIDPQTQ